MKERGFALGQVSREGDCRLEAGSTQKIAGRRVF